MCLPNMVLKKFGGLNMEKEELYPEEEMMIEQEAYKAFLSAAEYGSEGVKHLVSTIEQLQKRMEDYGSY